MRAVLVDRAAHRLLDGVGGIEAHIPLIEAERILDAVHHVADADDAGEGDIVEEGAHERGSYQAGITSFWCGSPGETRRLAARRYRHPVRPTRARVPAWQPPGRSADC